MSTTHPVDIVDWSASASACIEGYKPEPGPDTRVDVNLDGESLGTFGFEARTYDHDGDPSDPRTVLDVTIPDLERIGTIRDWSGKGYQLAPEGGRWASIFDGTARSAVDHVLHQRHTAPRRIATIHHDHARRFIAEDYGITREQADEMRAVMIAAAENARQGAGEGAWSILARFLDNAERLNASHIDSLALHNLIQTTREEMEQER